MTTNTNKNSHHEAKSLMPEHIAIIMDGNGRWAKKNKLTRFAGHRHGVNTVRKITRECGNIGIKYLTLFTFSSENWLRPPAEVNALMALLSSTRLTTTARTAKREMPAMETLGKGTCLVTIQGLESNSH